MKMHDDYIRAKKYSLMANQYSPENMAVDPCVCLNSELCKIIPAGCFSLA